MALNWAPMGTNTSPNHCYVSADVAGSSHNTYALGAMLMLQGFLLYLMSI
jgi:hypothetical protein